MKIANSIYDVVFKYLMEDSEVARDILSAILNEDIVTIEFLTQEAITVTEDGLSVLKLDFKAVIRSPKGQLRTILLEIQKAKTDEHVFRFRGYLGSAYLKKEDILSVDGNRKISFTPITSIYFLGSNLKNIKIPILKVAREYTNLITNEKINVKEDFIENLSHDLYVIQIKRLNKMASTDLEKILDVFNQEKYKTDNEHILEYTGDTSDPRIDRIVKRLNRATLDHNLLHQLVMQDAYDATMYNIKSDIAAQKRIAEEQSKIAEEQSKIAEIERKEKEKALAEVEIANAEIEKLKKQLAESVNNKKD